MLAEIITPKSIIFSDISDFLIVPGIEGDLGILDNHSYLVTNIRPGLVYIYKDKTISKKFFLKEGIFEFSNNKAILLTESAEDFEKINEGDLDKIIIDLENKEKHQELLDIYVKREIIKNQFYN
tara:strand:- start:461 stop:832 length:372 start_codon:yes stop_codon:yes gene_type:complete